MAVQDTYYSEDGVADAYIRGLDANGAETGPFFGIRGISNENFTRNVNEREILANNISFKKNAKFQSFSGEMTIWAYRMDMMRFYLAGSNVVDGDVSTFTEDVNALPDRFSLYVQYPLDGENGEPGIGWTVYPNCIASNLQKPRETGQYVEMTLSIDALYSSSTGFARRFAVDAASVGFNYTGVTTAPTVGSVTPADEATSVAVAADVVVVFDSAMAATTLANVELYDTDSGLLVPVAYTASTTTLANDTITLNPSSDLATSTLYLVRVPTSVRSAIGNHKAVVTNTVFTTTA